MLFVTSDFIWFISTIFHLTNTICGKYVCFLPSAFAVCTMSRTYTFDALLDQSFCTEKIYCCGGSPQGFSGGPWPDDRQPTQQVRGVAPLKRKYIKRRLFNMCVCLKASCFKIIPRQLCAILWPLLFLRFSWGWHTHWYLVQEFKFQAAAHFFIEHAECKHLSKLSI